MWEVVVRREVRPLIDELGGKRTGYRNAYEQLQQDPCLVRTTPQRPRPFAYRLSGPLEPKSAALGRDGAGGVHGSAAATAARTQDPQRRVWSWLRIRMRTP